MKCDNLILHISCQSPDMDFSASSNTVELQIPSLLTSIYNATIYIVSLLFLLGYEYPKTSFGIGMLLVFILLYTMLNSIIHAFFTTAVHRLPLAIALVLVVVAWYLHRLIQEYDMSVLTDAVTAAELAAVEQAKFLEYDDEGSCEGGGSSNGKELGYFGKIRERARSGGLDTDVWQGGQRVKRTGWTPESA
ncbi:hypothetical protein ONS95_007170 [Cadophora gregata]|uniref:uncharacterized protein n=1 Tax=Cadophora gregata TaxID=51156 RepID=UPI0026DC140D|nr:uncharacterized protein ONS95_007170 [Cadophora gregata]KAK0100719.1 hypothetical protein ONS95_007170 [Cadophora gregata]KAK0117284.1 hypothetical protein ONS96_013117 [Cadophora gregata f. sp. sojae]